MLPLWMCLGAVIGAGGPEPAHTLNSLYQDLLEHGATFDGTRVPFPPPTLRESQSVAEQRIALQAVAGSAERLEELMRDSISAPFILKTRDDTTKTGDLVRIADLWFILHATLEELDSDKFAPSPMGAKSKPVEAGNMKFTGHLLEPAELRERGLDVADDEKGSKLRETYGHVIGRLFERIDVESTDRVVATQSTHSRVIASATSRRFDRDPKYPNRWRTNARPDEPATYAGGASYLKMSALAGTPGTLLVEAHFAFDEPRKWFDGAPTLRSKFSIVAQQRIQSVRRELIESRKRP